MIYITSDHGGFELKKYLVEKLSSENYVIEDIGPFEKIINDDYPDYATKLANKVNENDENKGIVICRNGVGISIAVNKYKGIRAGISFNPKHAASSRNDDNTNVLAIPADYVSKKEALKIAKTWLTTPFSNQERHIRRIEKVDSL